MKYVGSNKLHIAIMFSIVIVSFSYYVFQSRFIIDNLNDKYINLIGYNSNREKAYLNIIKMQWELQNKKLFTNIILIDKDRNMLSIDSLIENSSLDVFFLIFEWDACQDCINQEIDFIEGRLIGMYNIAVIISFNSFNEFLAYMQSQKTKLPIYYKNRTDKIADYEPNNYGVHSFIINRNNEIILPHLANSSFPDLSLNYYNVLANKSANQR